MSVQEIAGGQRNFNKTWHAYVSSLSNIYNKISNLKNVIIFVKKINLKNNVKIVNNVTLTAPDLRKCN